MIVQDKLEKERNDAKNAVEEYVYDLRDKLCSIYEKYISEEVNITGISCLAYSTFIATYFFFFPDWYKYLYHLSAIFSCEYWFPIWISHLPNQDSSRLTLMLEDMENWLYEEGEDQAKQVYVDKLEELKVCDVRLLSAHSIYRIPQELLR